MKTVARFARTTIRISGGGSSLIIEDDGPGLDDEHIDLVLARGKRLDEHGHGLGLAIAHDLAEASGGAMTLGRAALGGLKVQIDWASAATA